MASKLVNKSGEGVVLDIILGVVGAVMGGFLFNLVGAERGSIGPFLGLSFLGVEFKISRGFFLTVDPSYIAFPVPHITGAPFGYYQYRFQVGLEFGG